MADDLCRRAMIGAIASIPLVAIPARVFAATPIGSPVIDSLTYNTTPFTGEKADQILAGGLSAVVIDLDIWPREPSTAVAELEGWGRRFNDPRMRVSPILRADDFGRAIAAKRLGIVLACQDASILGNSAGDFEERLATYYKKGLRILQLTHNGRTHWADSFMERRDGGLSDAGRDLAKLMNDSGIAIDVSHCSPQTTLDVVAVTTKPIMVTHAGCRALAPTARNKSDEEIRAIGRSGGYFGIFSLSTWLTDRQTVSIDTFINHVDHVAQLIGIESVGFGSDGDPSAVDAENERARMSRVQVEHKGTPSAEWPVVHSRIPALNGPDRMRRLADGLLARGYTDAHIAGVLGGNFVRVFRLTCG